VQWISGMGNSHDRKVNGIGLMAED
jgi:hypothetical protein